MLPAASARFRESHERIGTSPGSCNLRLGLSLPSPPSKLNERSGNVYENKGTAQKSTTPDPSLSKEGNFGLPSWDEKGVGVVPIRPSRSLRLGVKQGLWHRKIDERTGNVYENKG
jgi:hypothetical protein